MPAGRARQKGEKDRAAIPQDQDHGERKQKERGENAGKLIPVRICFKKKDADALDSTRKKTDFIANALKSCGLEAPVLCGRAEALPEVIPAADRVLCDVPCTGLGGGSKPDAMLNRTEEDMMELASLQLSILLNAADRVKPGGSLVYSTCTVSRRENAENARKFLEKRPDFTAEDCSFLVPGRPAGAPDFSPFLQLFPNTDGIDGFFIARFIKGSNRV